jgi:hypothetical protein
MSHALRYLCFKQEFVLRCDCAAELRCDFLESSNGQKTHKFHGTPFAVSSWLNIGLLSSDTCSQDHRILSLCELLAIQQVGDKWPKAEIREGFPKCYSNQRRITMNGQMTLLHVTDPQFQIIREAVLLNDGVLWESHDLELNPNQPVIPGNGFAPPEYGGEPLYTFTLTWVNDTGQNAITQLLSRLAPVTVG